MSGVREFLKTELGGWKKFEIAVGAVVMLIIFLTAVLKKDSPVALVYAVCGILYTIIAGKGKISCYIFGIISSICYCFLSFKSALWGNLALNFCYYLPMEIIGIAEWRKHLKVESREIIKTKLAGRERIFLWVICVLGCAAAVTLLFFVKDSHPVFDGITTVLSIAAMYLTIKRCIEQWIIWMIVNGLSVLMWLDIVFKGAKAYGAVIVWSVYFILAVYFYISWRKELINQK